MESPLTEVVESLKKVVYPSVNESLIGLRSADLPEQELRSCVALDLSFIYGCSFSFEVFEIKGLNRRRFKQNANSTFWTNFRTPVTHAIQIALLCNSYEQVSLFTPKNADYLKAIFDNKIPGLGDLVNHPSNERLELSFIVARSLRMIDHLVEKSGLQYAGSEDFIKKSGNLIAAFAGCKAGGNSYLNGNGMTTDWSHILKEPPSTAHLKAKQEPIPPSTESVERPLSQNPLYGLSNAGSAVEQYDQWVDYCKGVAELQRIPERLISDLIPPKEIADHSLKDLMAWEDALEQVFPGRRQWLLDEGVTRRDFDTFWGFPTWVQNFIEKLVARNQQLEYQGHTERGKSEAIALGLTAMFIPVYETFTKDVPVMFRPLPFELFERVRKFLATIDDGALQNEIIAKDLVTCNNFIRMCIKEKML